MEPSPTSADEPGRRSGLPAVLGRMFSSLRYRNYRLFFIGHTISTTGRWIQAVAMSWLVWELTNSKVWLGIAAAAGPLPMLFLSSLGGVVAERFERRRVLMVTQVLAALGPLALAVLLLVDGDCEIVRVWHLIAVAVLHGVVWAFDMPARQAFAVQMVGRRDLANAIGLNSSIFNVSRAGGAALGGMLLVLFASEVVDQNVDPAVGGIPGVCLAAGACPPFSVCTLSAASAAMGVLHTVTRDLSAVWKGAAVCFAANGLSFFALLVALMMMRFTGDGDNGPRRPPAPRHPLGGFIYVWTHRPIRSTMLLLVSATLFGWAFRPLLPAFTAESFGRGGASYGGMLSVFGVGSLAGALLMAYLGRYPNRQRLILIGIFLFAASIAAFTLVTSYTLALVALLVAGMGMLMCMAGINSYVQLSVNERFRGRVMGVYGTMFGGMIPFGALLAGWLAHWIGAPRAVQICLVALVTVAAGVALYWHRLPRRR